MSSTPRPPGTTSQSNGQSLNGSQWSAPSGAVQTPSSDDPSAMSTNTSGKDAIREGKQKARDTMAAAGVSPGGMANGSAQPNGGPRLSRKRSRDGSQKPVSQTTASSDAGEPTPSHDEVLLDRYVQRDLMGSEVINIHEKRRSALVDNKGSERDLLLSNEYRTRRRMNPGSIFGAGFLGYGNPRTDGRREVMYSLGRPQPRGRRSRPLPHIKRKDNAQQAEQHEELVPVRLDLELDKLRLRDTFTWNLHEKLIPKEVFVEHLLEDLKVPPENLQEVTRQVNAEMQEQIHNFYPHIIVEDGPLESGRPYSDHKDDEMRILIKLNITIGRITLIDQFEWDINNPLNSPEEFARSMAWENALSGEFTTAIAHSIREQSQLYTKSLYLTNHLFDGRPIEDPDIKDSLLPTPIHSAFRPVQTQKDWMPWMYEMSEAEVERTETSMMREHRAQKRQLNRRGGPALPDLKERQRTVRSLIVHSVIPGAVDSFETTGILKTRRSGRGGRRGGARADGDVDSDDLDSDDSSPESPAPSAMNPGTARTRGMRGAASAAQAAMRANLGRSVTPDSQTTPVHETRTSARAPPRSNLREDEVEDDTLIVKLKIGRAKLRAFWDSLEAKRRASQYPLSGYASQPPAAAALPTPSRATTTAAGGGPATPRARGNTNTPQPNGHTRASSSARRAESQSRAEGDHWPTADEAPPPPPAWLSSAIQQLRDNDRENDYKSDFQPLMRPYAVNAETGATEKTSHLEPGAPMPRGVKVEWRPRIRCNDCPGKLYTAVQGEVVEQFQVHLRNRHHREKVVAREAGESASGR